MQDYDVMVNLSQFWEAQVAKEIGGVADVLQTNSKILDAGQEFVHQFLAVPEFIEEEISEAIDVILYETRRVHWIFMED
jgi:hypothetical protein